MFLYFSTPNFTSQCGKSCELLSPDTATVQTKETFVSPPNRQMAHAPQPRRKKKKRKKAEEKPAPFRSEAPAAGKSLSPNSGQHASTRSICPKMGASGVLRGTTTTESSDRCGMSEDAGTRRWRALPAFVSSSRFSLFHILPVLPNTRIAPAEA